jgi:hypothetical protein
VLTERGDAWYVVKAYGAGSPCNADVIDVPRFAEQCLATGATPYTGDGQVALTSPLYFRRNVAQPDPAPLKSTVRLSVQGAAPEVIDVYDKDAARVTRHTAPADASEIDVPLAGQAVARFADGRTIDYVPERDNAALNELLARTYLGTWRRDHPQAQPGQMPADMMDIARYRECAKRTEWCTRESGGTG